MTYSVPESNTNYDRAALVIGFYIKVLRAILRLLLPVMPAKYNTLARLHAGSKQYIKIMTQYTEYPGLQLVH